MGLKLNEALNARAENGFEGKISTDDSRLATYVFQRMRNY